MSDLKLDDLTLDNIGDWPVLIKGVVIAVLCAAVAFAGYWYLMKPQYETLAKEEATESAKKREYAQKQRKAANLENYKAQLVEMNESFGTMLRQLPNKAEIADLLVEVSQTGLASGLEFKSFEPRAETAKEFYSEVPINISVLGKYNEFGDFISGLASLPRIVTIHDVEITRNKKDSNELKLSAIAKTYRYLEEDADEK